MTKDVLFEIGLEELPARFVRDAEAQLASLTKKWLEDERITFNEITTFSTPRRLAVQIEGIADSQKTIEEEARGPAEKIAKDAEGNWTKAAIGFAKGQGKSVDDLYFKEVKDTAYIFVNKRIEGLPTEVILKNFDQIITSIQFSTNMRWGSGDLRYARPIRWLVALYGEKVLEVELNQVKAGRKTKGHRFLGATIELEDPKQYESALEKQFVIVDYAKRRALIESQMKQIEAETGHVIKHDEELLDEVTNLVEYPQAFIGNFAENYLVLPAEVLITSMKEHQRYFPVTSKEGELLAHFIGVRNGNKEFIETVQKGNEKVLHARLSDAEFFFAEDKKASIEFYMEKLKNVVFQEKIGTYYEKVLRIVKLAKEIAAGIRLSEVETKQLERAAYICKFDLMTNIVHEFTELQGVMGEAYARYFGEDEAVAIAIREHYLPVQASGALPETKIGAIVAIADKLDTIVGCIATGLLPSGSQDPYGLRRQATGILRILKDQNWELPVETLFKLAEALFKNADEEVKGNIRTFFKQRVSYLMRELNVEQDIVQAVTELGIGNFSYAIEKALVLKEKRNDENFIKVEEALLRVLNLTKDRAYQVDEVQVDKFETDSERALYGAYLEVKSAYEKRAEEKNAQLALSELAKLANPIHAFFEHNMVMTDDEAIRHNRLVLLNNIRQVVLDYANLRLIEWKQHI